MNRLAHIVLLSWGWRRLALAFAAGLITALAQAPYSFLPALLVSYPVLVLLLDGAVPARGGVLPSVRPAFVTGWVFGFGQFLGGLWWLGTAYVTEADMFGPLLPLALASAVVGLPAVLAVFTGLGAVLARLAWSEGPGRVVATAAGLWASDYARGHLFTGLPWNLPGQVLASSDVLMQVHAVLGPYGASLLVVFVAAAPAALWPAESRSRGGWAVTVTALGLLAATAGYGTFRLAHAGDGFVPDVSLRIVQPSVPADAPVTREGRQAIFGQLLALSDSRPTQKTYGIASRTHVIWPETVVPFLIAQSPEQLRQIASLFPTGTSLIAGGVRASLTGDGTAYYNTAFVLNNHAEIVDQYDKVHLVPFGEYVPAPFAALVRSLGVRQLAGFLDNPYSPGTGPHTLAIPGAPPAAALICYEIAFDGEGLEAAARPKWIIALSDDSWFGKTAGPWQHLAIARLRAVAEGLPVVRAANSGISAIIDSYGRTQKQTETGYRGVLDGNLPASLEGTPYTAAGGGRLAAILAAVLITFLVICRKTSTTY